MAAGWSGGTGGGRARRRCGAAGMVRSLTGSPSAGRVVAISRGRVLVEAATIILRQRRT